MFSFHCTYTMFSTTEYYMRKLVFQCVRLGGT